MEENTKYEKKRFGEIPRNSRIEYSYQLIGATMGLLGECNAMIADVLNNKYVSAYKIGDQLDNVAKLTHVIRSILHAEAFDRNEEPLF